MIQLAGKKVDQDIEIVYTGLRPGEKLFEELLHEKEELITTPHHKILMAKHRQVSWESLINVIDQLQQNCRHYSDETLLPLLKQLVPEFMPNEKIIESSNVTVIS
jgi:FlaA1/EpsC-like NDP-sugar epimerase